MDYQNIISTIKSFNFLNERADYINSLNLSKNQLLELCKTNSMNVESSVKKEEIIKRLIVNLSFD